MTREITKLLSTKELSSLLGLSQNYLKNLRSDGKGPVYVKLRGRVKYDQKDVVTWINKLKRRRTKNGEQDGRRKVGIGTQGFCINGEHCQHGFADKEDARRAGCCIEGAKIVDAKACDNCP